MTDRSGRIALHVDSHELPDDVAAYVNSLSLIRALNGTYDGWMSGYVNYPDVQPGQLQQEIERKAARVAGYKSAGIPLWLLIRAEPTNEAQALDVTDEVRAVTFAGPFERVFFLDSRNRAAELRLK
jgi:hypothetical protein